MTGSYIRWPSQVGSRDISGTLQGDFSRKEVLYTASEHIMLHRGDILMREAKNGSMAADKQTRPWCTILPVARNSFSSQHVY